MSLIRNVFTAFVGNSARKHGKGNGLMGFGVGVLAARVATRSVPGALLVGGAMVAKALYNRSKEKEELLPTSDRVIDIEAKPVSDDKKQG
ncbi:MAG: hypothetical protein V7676_07240 [Parasphingorhabdus sp.]|uniref:hypothetical protein n=1 Tax=Parasphingorhabdus sp. TaxID=2709688 RepID=UPI0030023803